MRRERSVVRPRTAWRAGALALAAAAVGLAVGAPPPPIVVCALAWAGAAATCWYVIATDDLCVSAISPVLIVGGLAAVYGIAVPLSLAARQDTFLLGIDYRPWFPVASAMCAVSAIAFAVGAALGRRPANPAPPPMVELDAAVVVGAAARDRLARVGRALAVVAALVSAYRVARYGLGGWTIRLSDDRAFLQGATAYITYGPQYLAGVLLFFAYRGRTRAARRASTAFAVVLTGYFLAGGARYQVVVMVGTFGLLWYWRTHRRALPPARYLGAAVAIGVLLLGVLGNLRSEATGGAGGGISTSASDSFEVFLPLAGVVAHTEQRGFLLGTSYTYLAEQVVPRTLWPNKPGPPTVTAIGQFTNVQEGRAFPVWGELFLNFGWYGVIGGMGAFGYGLRRWLGYWRWNRERFATLDILAAVTIALLVQWVSRGLFVQLVYNTMGLLIGPLILYVVERRQAQMAPAEPSAPAAATAAARARA